MKSQNKQSKESNAEAIEIKDETEQSPIKGQEINKNNHNTIKLKTGPVENDIEDIKQI